MTKAKDFLDQIRAGNEALLEKLFRKTRTQLLAWLRNEYPLDAKEASQVYIEAFQILLDKIGLGEERLLNWLFKEYRNKFIRWTMGKYKCDEEDAREVYVKAFSIMYYNIRDKKITELTSSLETYLFGIGKNVFREKYKDKHRMVQELDEQHGNKEYDTSMLDRYQAAHRKEVVNKLLDEIGEPCKSVLTFFFFKKYSMEAIANSLGFKNDVVAKTRKYKCLKQLRTLVGDSKLEGLLN